MTPGAPMADPGQTDPRLLVALVSWSLTGDQVPGEEATPLGIVGALSRAGWDAGRIAGRRDRERAAGRPWPQLPDAQRRRGVGSAQLHALVLAVCGELRLGPRPRVRDWGMPLSQRDRALLAERPPHHGSVG